MSAVDELLHRRREGLGGWPNSGRTKTPELDPYEVAHALGGVVALNGWVHAPGPGHSANDRSLAVLVTPEDPEGFKTKSFSGDDWRDCRAHVREALGLPPPQRYPEFIYKTADGEPYLRVLKPPKPRTPFQQHWADGDWHPGKPRGPKVPYRLPELLAAPLDEVVYVTEGEKDAERVAALGLIATTNSEGAGSWSADLTPHFRGRTVRILADNDEPGRKHAQKVAKELASVAAEVRIAHLPDLPEKGDVSDWMDADPQNDRERLVALCDEAPVFALGTDDQAIHATPYRWRDPASIPRREWLYDHFIRRFVTATLAPSGVGKSAMALVEAVAMAAGRNLLKVKDPAKAPLKVWYWNGEDPLEELERRVAAICLRYGLTAADLEGRLFLNSGRDCPIIVATEDRSGLRVDGGALQDLERTIGANQIDAVILDPFVTVHGVNENDNNGIGTTVGLFADLAERTNCAVELVHHVRKKGPGGGDVTVDDGRGAGAFKDRVRSARVLNPMTVDEGNRFDLPAEVRRSLVKVENGKSNLAPPPEAATWLRKVAAGIGGSLTAYQNQGGGFCGHRFVIGAGAVQTLAYGLAAPIPSGWVERPVIEA